MEGTIFVSVNPGFESVVNFPLYMTVLDMSNNVMWSSELCSSCWTLWPWITWTKLKIVDSLGNLIYSWVWDPIKDGCISHQLFHLWALKNKGSFGIAIGTHDGMWGEWVGMVADGHLRALLVEASDKQFEKLENFYSGRKWVRCEKKLITTDGHSVIFYEGGSGHTNSIKKSHIEMTVQSDITETLRESQSLISLLEENPNCKWLHIDVEGIDDELILSLRNREELLPEVLIYEHEALGVMKESSVIEFLEQNNYQLFKGNSRNTIAFKK